MVAERFESAWWQTSSLLLVADREAVAIDACISREEVAGIARRAAELGAGVVATLTTHADWDHVCGIAAFPEAEAAMGLLAAARVESGEAARRCGENATKLGLELAGPPRVDRRLQVGRAHRVGPLTVETFALVGHTEDGVAFRVRELDLLAVGDHLSTIEFPFVSDTVAYRATLAALIELLRRDPPGRIVPGHGPEHTAREAIAVAEADLGYLWQLRAAVAGALADGEDAARAAGLEVETPRAAENGEQKHADNVAAQLAELVPGD